MHRGQILFTVVLGLVAASALMLSVQAFDWWIISDVSIRPLGSHHCMGGPCDNASLAWMGGEPTWERMGTATFAAALLLSLVTLIVTGALAAGRRTVWLVQFGGVAGLTALGAAMAFWLMRPTMGEAEIASGPAVFALGWLAAAGVLVRGWRYAHARPAK